MRCLGDFKLNSARQKRNCTRLSQSFNHELNFKSHRLSVFAKRYYLNINLSNAMNQAFVLSVHTFINPENRDES
jgi:hypothetical protein